MNINDEARFEIRLVLAMLAIFFAGLFLASWADAIADRWRAMIGIRWVWRPPRGPWDANFGWQPTPCIEQDNALELVGAVETKLRRIKAMMTLLGVQASRREISNGGFYAHDYSGRPQSLRIGTRHSDGSRARAFANDNQPHRRGDRGRVHRRPAPL
jgi:hypothetical protein